MGTPEPTTLIETLSQESSTSRAPERVRPGVLTPKWLSAQATKLMHPDRQVRVVFSKPREQEIFEVLLSGPEAESAIRQLMQAYSDSIGKSLQFCAYPKELVRAVCERAAHLPAGRTLPACTCEIDLDTCLIHG